MALGEDPIVKSLAEAKPIGLISSEPHHRLWRYGPVILWAIVIFMASTSALSASNTSILVKPIHWLFPGLSDATLNFIHGVVLRKGAHFTEFAILGLLAARAFRSSSHRFLRHHWLHVSLLLVIVYALHLNLIDEPSQFFQIQLAGTYGGRNKQPYKVLRLSINLFSFTTEPLYRLHANSKLVAYADDEQIPLGLALYDEWYGQQTMNSNKRVKTDPSIPPL